ncbi:glycosyltransferase family 4 protein [Bradyrhizobium diazoefficiens]|nr:glycosyltransferase family 4 protein [Bradyrhizobium diazoefficiens]MBR0772463.1 glycosyltransferase family 4 protein [Bradyrhizobium diazoefficiens]
MALRTAEQERRVVLFQQVAPAAFSMPVRLRAPSFILLDWTRKLYEPILKKKLSNGVDTFIHRKAMSRVTGVMAFTEAAERSVIKDYGIEAESVFRIPMPFDVERYQMAPARDGKVKLLFVGADFHRKGGDVVLDWFRARGRFRAELTMVTQSDMKVDGVNIIKNKPGEDMAPIYAANDVLVLPTRCDAYPQVVGEAASAGLALATTDTALGAPEVIVQGWNGFIAATENFQGELDSLVSDRSKIEMFKRNSREKMKGFTFKEVACAIDTIVNTTRRNLQ